MITDAGTNDIVANYMLAQYTTIKVGNGGDDTASSQTELDALVVSKVVTPSALGSQIVWTVEFTGSEIGSQGISELGIFKTSDDTLLSRVTFPNTGVIASNDSITFTIRMEVN
tara:strand:- start:1212 stop:1550 length:339 start_codon:yes stop_codon:yes gene_type:complete